MKASLFPALIAITLSHAKILEERQSNWTVGQTVQTDSGLVHGHAATNATQVSEYLGIPFAVPPVGDLRFAVPQKFSGNSTINGTSFVRYCALYRNAEARRITDSIVRDFLARQLH
jgi:hypothetical protein